MDILDLIRTVSKHPEIAFIFFFSGFASIIYCIYQGKKASATFLKIVDYEKDKTHEKGKLKSQLSSVIDKIDKLEDDMSLFQQNIRSDIKDLRNGLTGQVSDIYKSLIDKK